MFEPHLLDYKQRIKCSLAFLYCPLEKHVKVHTAILNSR